MRKLALIFTFIFTGAAALCQDFHFSQFYEAPLLNNPASSGLFTGNFRAQVLYRNQWNAVAGPYKTTAASLEFKFMPNPCNTSIDPDAKLIPTVGLQVIQDKSGAASRFNRSEVALNLAVRTPRIGNMYLSGAFFVGYAGNVFNRDGLSWSDEYRGDQYVPNSTNQPLPGFAKSFWDVGLGAMAKSSTESTVQWYAGIGLYHVVRQNLAYGNTYDTLKMRATANLGIAFRFLPDYYDNIAFFANPTLRGKEREIMLGTYYSWYFTQPDGSADDQGVSLGLGGFWRVGDALIPSVRLAWDNWVITASYDATSSKIKTLATSASAYEVSLKFRGFLSGAAKNCAPVGCDYFAH